MGHFYQFHMSGPPKHPPCRLRWLGIQFPFELKTLVKVDSDTLNDKIDNLNLIVGVPDNSKPVNSDAKVVTNDNDLKISDDYETNAEKSTDIKAEHQRHLLPRSAKKPKKSYKSPKKDDQPEIYKIFERIKEKRRLQIERNKKSDKIENMSKLTSSNKACTESRAVESELRSLNGACTESRAVVECGFTGNSLLFNGCKPKPKNALKVDFSDKKVKIAPIRTPKVINKVDYPTKRFEHSSVDSNTKKLNYPTEYFGVDSNTKKSPENVHFEKPKDVFENKKLQMKPEKVPILTKIGLEKLKMGITTTSSPKVRRISTKSKQSRDKKKGILVNKITKYFENFPSEKEFLENSPLNIEHFENSDCQVNTEAEKPPIMLPIIKPIQPTKVSEKVKKFENFTSKDVILEKDALISNQNRKLGDNDPLSNPSNPSYHKIIENNSGKTGFTDRKPESVGSRQPIVGDKTKFPEDLEERKNTPKLGRKKDDMKKNRVMMNPIESYFKNDEKTEACGTPGKRKLNLTDGQNSQVKKKKWVGNSD